MNKKFFIIAITVIFTLVFISCEGPTGPQGEPGGAIQVKDATGKFIGYLLSGGVSDLTVYIPNLDSKYFPEKIVVFNWDGSIGYLITDFYYQTDDTAGTGTAYAYSTFGYSVWNGTKADNNNMTYYVGEKTTVSIFNPNYRYASNDWKVLPYIYNMNYTGLCEQTIVQKNAILGNLTVTGPLTLYFGE